MTKRLAAIDNAISALAVALVRTGSPDDHMHITVGDGNALGLPTDANDWMMRVQYAKDNESYDSTKEQWSIVRCTLRPSTTHGTDYDTIDITWVSSGADAPAEWPIGSVVYCVISKSYWDETLSTVMSSLADHAYDGRTITGEAGEDSLAFPMLLYYDFANEDWRKADKDSIDTCGGALAILLTSSADDEDPITLLLPDSWIRDDTWAFGEGRQYVGDDGALAGYTDLSGYEASDVIRKIGDAYSLGLLHFYLSPDPGVLT